jgi:hypothetical protein
MVETTTFETVAVDVLMPSTCYMLTMLPLHDVVHFVRNETNPLIETWHHSLVSHVNGDLCYAY